MSAVDSLLRPFKIDIYGLLLEKHDKGSEVEKKYFSIKEAVRYSGVSRWTLARLGKNGGIVFAKLSKSHSGKVLILKESLDKYLESCCSTAL